MKQYCRHAPVCLPARLPVCLFGWWLPLLQVLHEVECREKLRGKEGKTTLYVNQGTECSCDGGGGNNSSISSLFR